MRYSWEACKSPQRREHFFFCWYSFLSKGE